jgi:hypothetical protein
VHLLWAVREMFLIPWSVREVLLLWENISSMVCLENVATGKNALRKVCLVFVQGLRAENLYFFHGPY